METLPLKPPPRMAVGLEVVAGFLPGWCQAGTPGGSPQQLVAAQGPGGGGAACGWFLGPPTGKEDEICALWFCLFVCFKESVVIY